MGAIHAWSSVAAPARPSLTGVSCLAGHSRKRYRSSQGGVDAMSERDKWTLPTADQIAKMSRKALRERIHAYIERAERGGRPMMPGGIEQAIMRAQYLTEELARRNQNWQTWAIIIMTAFITAMTLVLMVATIWPETFHSAQSAVKSLPSHVP
jgi:hypothetical protein